VISGSTPGGLRYRIDGPPRGRPVLLLHALGTTMGLWDGLAQVLADRYRVIRYDARGHGQSRIPEGEYSIDDLGRDALSVLDAVGVERAIVGGISIGGLTSLWLGIHAVGRVEKLLVANTAAKVGSRQRWIDRVALVRSQGMAAVAELAMGNWFTEDFRKREPATVDRLRGMVTASPVEGYVGCCAALREVDLRDDLSRIEVPALLVASERDPSTPVAETALIAERIPHATLVRLDAAHLSNIERPAEFAREAQVFFASAG